MIRQSFNENWTYQKDSSTMMSAGAAAPVPVTLPHDAMILEERNPSNPSGNAGAFYPGGNYIYSKTFFVPTDYAGKDITLEFEGVYRKARVYVNGAFAGSCATGYRNFLVDITPYLICGADNTLSVKVNNGDVPNSRWYTGSGIYRPVNMLVGNEIHMLPYGLKIRTPEAAEDISVIETEMHFANHCTTAKKVYFITTLTDMDGTVVAEENTPVTVLPGKAPVIYQRIYVRNAKLWSVDAPNLYTCTVNIMDADGCGNAAECLEKGILLDQTVCNVGIRHIQMDPVHGLRINGETVKLRGACLHHDNGVVGAATFADAEERRVRLLKEAGFNALRIAHNSSSVQLLDASDRLGVLVMEESFDMWHSSKNPYDDSVTFADEWEKDLEAIVAKDYNHPCVIMYCIGNEIPEVGTPTGAAVNRELANKFRELDSTRYVTNSVNGLFTIMNDLPTVLLEQGVITQEQLVAMMAPAAEDSADAQKPDGDVNDLMTLLIGQMDKLSTHHFVSERLEEGLSGLDISGYNYMTGRYDYDSEHYPNRMLFGSETYPPEIDNNWKHVKNNPRVLGDFTWTGWDYIGEAGVGVVDYNTTTGFFKPFPVYMAYCGDIDIIGNRRAMSYYREIVWGLRKAPYITVEYPQHYYDRPFCTPWSVNDSLASWTWPGYEDKPVKVWVYSDSEEVELLLNGKSLGRVPAGEENRFKALFDIVYQPGTLEAVSYIDGEETGRTKLLTAGEETYLAVSAEKKTVRANGEDLVYLNITLTDDDGNLNTAACAKVAVTVEGCGSLQGFGSADPKSTENFFDAERTTFNGKVLAVVRAGFEPGEIKITVSADGYESKAVTVKAV